MPRRAAGDVEAGVRRDLAKLEAPMRRSGLAVTALALAKLLDGEFTGVCRACQVEAEIEVDTTARDAAALARELRTTLLELAKFAPAKPHKDRVDDLRARREARRAESAKSDRRAAATDPVGP